MQTHIGSLRPMHDRCAAIATQGGQQCERKTGHRGNHEVTTPPVKP